MFQTIVVSVWSPGRLSYSSDVFQIHLHTMSGRYNINCNSVWGINMQRCLALGLCSPLASGHRPERVWLFVCELCVGHSSFKSGVGPPLWLLQTPLSFSSPQGSLCSGSCSARAQEGAPEGGARREDKQGTRENPWNGGVVSRPKSEIDKVEYLILNGSCLPPFGLPLAPDLSFRPACGRPLCAVTRR